MFEAGPAPAEVVEAFYGTIGRRAPARRPDGRTVFGSQDAIAYWPR